MADNSLTQTLPAEERRAALDALPDPVFVFDADGDLRYWNAAASDATGRDDDALGAAALADVFDGITVETLAEAADARGTVFEALLSTAGGGHVAVEVRASAMPAAGGRRFVAVARERPDGDLPGDERRGILDRMTDAFFALDEEFRLTYVNDRAREIIVAAAADDPDGDLRGRLFLEVVPEVVDTTFHEQYRTAMETQEAVSFEEYYEPLDAWIAVRAYPSPSGLSVYFRDVTERRRRESALAERERVLREIHDITADTERSFTEQVNALLDLGIEVLGTSTGAFSRIRGASYEFEAVRGDTDTQPGDVVPVEATNCERTATQRQTLVMSDVARDAPELTEKTGYTEWGIACYLGAPVFVEGDVYGTFCFYDDESRDEPFSEWEVALVDLMSQWVGYEVTRQRVRERLESQNEKLEQFASIVSHDLRNPLNVLTGYLDVAEETGDAEHFQQCRDSVERMEALVEDLLSLARAGEGVDDVSPTDLAAAVEDAWGSVETGRATLAAETDAVIRADGVRLQQLLANLFRNAVEHAGESVAVTVGELDGGFYVADDGPGIPADERENVFEMGYTTSGDGTGFGLHIAAEVAAAHGWTVEVTEGEGGGARFEFTGVEAA